MKICDVISELDSIRVNNIDTNQKLQWIIDMENSLVDNLLQYYGKTKKTKYSLDDDTLLESSRLYILYMLARLSFSLDSMEEYNDYVNGYNYELSLYKNFITRNNIVKNSATIQKI